MQGSSSKKLPRWLTPIGFTAAFLAGAVTIFYALRTTGAALGLEALPFQWRVSGAGALLALLALADVKAICRGTYCPLSCRRQTPKAIIRRYPIPLVASVWGLDTGLVITTFRVAAATWASLLLALLGLAPHWAGLAYGFGFVLPFLCLLLHPRLGESAFQARPTDPGLEAMLKRRGDVQRVSAILLILSGTTFLIL